nr:MAG TPA: tail tape measure [Caudoviricetes sp.]
MNNKQFLSAIQESASSMDKLKGALKLDQATSGFNRLSEIAKNTTFGDLAAKALDIGKNMTVMQGMGLAAFGGIGAAALSAGQQILSGFFQTVKDGFNEYELKMRAIQTIMANTAEKGTTLGEVKTSLAELNTYADKTVYSFSDMTNAIGLFTAAGVDLQTSVASIKGLSNLAAASGSTAQQTATAYTQLSQAISAGVIHLQDWNSLVNAGMGGESFRNALIETSRMMGTGVDEAIAKKGSFRESLREDWLTAEVMTKTLTALTNDLSEAQLVEMGYSEEQAAKLKLFAGNAFDAATKVRTFSQLIDTTKEAIGSGWAETFEILFGDFDEATELFTSISNWLGLLIGDSARARNGFLQMWKDLGGRSELVRGLGNIFQALVKVIGQVISAFRDVFANASAEGLFRMTKAFADFTEKLIITDNFADKLQWTFTGLFSVFHILWTIVSEVGQVIFTVAAHIIGALFPAFAGVNSGIFQITKVLGKVIFWFDRWFMSLDIGGKVLKLLLPPIDLVGKAIKWVVEKIHDFIMWLDVGTKVTKVGQALKDLSSKFGLVKEAIKNSVIGQQFITAFETVQDTIDKAKNKIHEFGENVGNKLKAKLNSGKAAISDYFKGFSLGDLSSSEVIISKLTEKFNELGEKMKIAEKVQWLKEKLIELKDALEEVWHKIQNSSAWEKLGTTAHAAGQKFKELAISFRDWVNGHGDVKQKAGEAAGAVASVGTATAQAAKDAAGAAKQNFLLKWAEDIKRIAQQLHLPELFETIKQKLVEFKNFIKQQFAPDVKGAAMKAFGGIGEALSKSNDNLKSYDMGKILVGAIGAGTLIAFTRWINSFKKNFDKIGDVAEKFGNVLDQLGGVLEGFQERLKAKALLTIAIALGVLAGALVVMSLVPAPKLLITLGVMKVLFNMLNDMIESMGKMVAFKKHAPLIMGLLIALGAALILMAVAVRILAGMDVKGALIGVISMQVLLGSLAEFLKQTTHLKGVERGATLLMGLAISCILLATAVYMLGSMKLGTALQGVIALNLIIWTLTGFMQLVSQNPFMAKGAGILLGLAVSVNILVSAIYLLGSMDTGRLVQGTVAVTVLIAVLSVATNVAGRGGGRGAAAILAMSIAIMALVGAVYLLGSMDIVKLAQGMIALAAGLAILVFAMAAADTFKEGAIGLAIGSISLMVLAMAMERLAGLSWIQVAIGLVALAGGLIVLLAAAYVAEMVAPGLVLLTAVLLAFGLALLPISIGLAAFAAVLGICATTGSAAFLVLTEGLQQLGAILPQLAIDLANAIANFIITLGDKAPELAVAMAKLIGAMWYAIIENTPLVVSAIFTLISAILTEMDNHAYEYGAKGADTVAKFIQGIADNMQSIINAGADLVINFLDGIGNNAGRIIDKAAWTILKFLEGVRDAINNYAPRFRKVGKEIAWAIIDGVTDGLASKAWKIGSELVNGAKNGISKMKSYLGIASPSRLMKTIGGFMGEGLAIGIRAEHENIANASEGMGKTAYEALSQALEGVNELIEEDPSYKPEVKPVLNLEEMEKQAKGINSLMPAIGTTLSAANGARPTIPVDAKFDDKNSQNGTTNITFNQTNNSPEALDAADIYRNTKTQLAMAKDALTV